MDCGPTCLWMICKHHGKNIDIDYLKEHAQTGKRGVSMLGLSEAAEKSGFRTLSVEIPFRKLVEEAPLPCILHWQQNHFVVLAPGSTAKRAIIADPAYGILKYDAKEFTGKWTGSTDDAPGIALLLEPTPAFAAMAEHKDTKLTWGFLTQYLRQYKRYYFQLLLGVIIASILQLIFPFLTQNIVDVGINTRNINFVYIILLAQFFLFSGRVVTDFLRSRILLYIGTRVNISILSDFWIKLMKLPVSYFDIKKAGDIIQRIGDHGRLQQFLTATSLNTLFSTFNIIIFSIALLMYDFSIYLVFMAGSILYFLWIKIFLKYRRRLDVQRFSLASMENSATMQLVMGIQEIRLTNSEKKRRWEWEKIQAALYRLSFKSLSISQYQQAGAFFINEGKNILITFLAAKLVIDGQLTLGAMLAITYIIGQLNSPVENLISFVQQAQDARLSLERLNDVHKLANEEDENVEYVKHLPQNTTIRLKDLLFKYPGVGNDPVLKKINLEIPAGKVTAIVGMSGSGKTTLFKLLMKIYDNYTGEIKIGNQNLKHISASFWREQCGIVMQDGYIFSDTIANNILTGESNVNFERLEYACKVANIMELIESLPLGFNTLIGPEGIGLSQGQKQRILIARAVYRDPKFIFFDEATNALDATNEKVILENLQEFFQDRTVVMIAHRLSTVKNADHIIVFENGYIVESGRHEDLTSLRGSYFHLVKNQLELGN